MKITTITLLAAVLLIFLGCGNQEQPAKQLEDTKQTVTVPKVDLHSAIVTGDLETIRQHIAAGSDLNVLEASRASTPLITSAAFGDTEAAKMLIDAGADLNYQNADGSTALHTAAAFGKTEVAKILIDAGVDLNTQNNFGSTALHAAAFLCRTEIVEILLAKGAGKTLINKDGKTALESVVSPFEEVKSAYDAVGASLLPLGIKLDYERIKATRPKIVELLK